MKSKLEEQILQRKKPLQVGEKIVYSDVANYIKYKVVSVCSDGFVVKDCKTKEENTYLFNQLQYGWQLAS